MVLQKRSFVKLIIGSLTPFPIRFPDDPVSLTPFPFPNPAFFHVLTPFPAFPKRWLLLSSAPAVQCVALSGSTGL